MLSQHAEFMEKYSALNVERLMQDFENDKPTLKDVTTLISIMNKAIRLVDDKFRESIANASRKSYIVAVELNYQMQNLRKDKDYNHRGRKLKHLLSIHAPWAPTEIRDEYVHDLLNG